MRFGVDTSASGLRAGNFETDITNPKATKLGNPFACTQMANGDCSWVGGVGPIKWELINRGEQINAVGGHDNYNQIERLANHRAEAWMRNNYDKNPSHYRFCHYPHRQRCFDQQRKTMKQILMNKAKGYMGRPNGQEILNYQLCRAGTQMAEHNWGWAKDLGRLTNQYKPEKCDSMANNLRNKRI